MGEEKWSFLGQIGGYIRKHGEKLGLENHPWNCQLWGSNGGWIVA